MSKPCGLMVLLSLFCISGSQSGFAAPGGQAPEMLMVVEECPPISAQPLGAANALEAALLPSLPGMTPKPMPLFPWICGDCSEPACLDLYEGAECTLGYSTGTCYASFATLCSTSPRRYYCACFCTEPPCY
jgi:hypothetical protein